MKNTLARQLLAETPNEVRQFVRRYAELTLRINQLLEEKGWTQKDLADKMGKSPSEISKWLSGEHNFTLRSLAKLEAELGADLIAIPTYSTLNLLSNKVIKITSVRSNLGTISEQDFTPASKQEISQRLKVSVA